MLVLFYFYIFIIIKCTQGKRKYTKYMFVFSFVSFLCILTKLNQIPSLFPYKCEIFRSITLYTSAPPSPVMDHCNLYKHISARLLLVVLPAGNICIFSLSLHALDNVNHHENLELQYDRVFFPHEISQSAELLMLSKTRGLCVV